MVFPNVQQDESAAWDLGAVTGYNHSCYKALAGATRECRVMLMSVKNMFRNISEYLGRIEKRCNFRQFPGENRRGALMCAQVARPLSAEAANHQILKRFSIAVPNTFWTHKNEIIILCRRARTPSAPKLYTIYVSRPAIASDEPRITLRTILNPIKHK